MEEPYGEGVASRPDPEPHAVSREAGGGALARARAGWVLSSEIVVVGGADAVKIGGRPHSAGRYARWAGTSRSRRPHACAEPLCAETGRSVARPRRMASRGPHREADRRISMMHGLEKSDRLTVPKKPSKKAERSAAERAEGRSLAKGNPPRSDTNRMQSRSKVNSALRRIRQATERDKRVRFTSLTHHIYSVDTLREAYFGLKREAAPGVDGETWR